MGYSEDESTWKPGTSLGEASKSIDEFYFDYPKVIVLII
jgi:hypothetical protein